MTAIDKNTQVHALIAAGKTEQALAVARRMVQSAGARPGAPACDALRAALVASGQTEQALHFARAAVQADPRSTIMQLELAKVYSLLGRAQDESRVLEGVLAATPDAPDVYAFLASAYEREDRLDDAERIAREGYARFPTEHQIIMRLASAVSAQGRPGEAVDLYRRALFLRPGDHELIASLGPTLQYESPAEPDQLLAVHENFGRLLEQLDFRKPYAHARPMRAPADRPGRPLRVGFLSSDLRRHSVAAFATPLLQGLDPLVVTPIAYMTGFSLDAATDRIRAAVERARGVFRHVVDQTDVAIAQRIVDDKIDVLVEMNGLTRGHRMGVIRFKPAPVIIHWCGYPSTTGVRLIDYRLVDSITDPPGAERWMAERLLRVDPCFTCYGPPVGAPDVAVRDGAPGEPVTFGSFNMLHKVNDDVLRLWARVLERCPSSRMLIKAVLLSHESVRKRVLERLVKVGAEASRITLVPPTEQQHDHLSTYHRVDIALDTFPYAGTTTTCEALWMGVPVVTLAPPEGLHATRVGASLLSAVGHPEWIAATQNDYVRIATDLASDAAQRAAVRQTLRGQMRSSVLCDGHRFAVRFGQAVVDAWLKWARGG